MHRLRKMAICAFLLGISALPAAEPPDPSVFGEGVRPTPWLSPQQELDSFHVLPGFEVRLFAAEPDIAKPLNLAPDSKGRIWVTCTVEYPYPADGRTGRDFVMVLEDTDGDGSADQFTRFADQLNIPMGVLPYGTGCICFSIPNLYYLQDTDGDGVCDRRDVILGPFDTTRDTHGMINALRDGGDGWIYACHGFNNQSEVAGTDGHVVKMTSGNTFRFRPDGSRVELFTRGQVNPFGMTEDQWGYRYTADCHSKPITQLIRGASYPSFGRPHDGLGFLPPMMDHLHGSTAISGIQFIMPTSHIEPLRDQLISGNVMTSRINRNRLWFQGATARATEQSDFLWSDDPWFRPVDIRLGRDGYLYVADFYNKIIGHYEVPLDHPERDRTSGRIWQIRYIGDGDQAAESTPTVPIEYRQLQGFRSIARRDGKFVELAFVEALNGKSPRFKVEALRLAAELTRPSDRLKDLVRAALSDPNPHIERAAAECLGHISDYREIPRLLVHLPPEPTDDPVLRQTYRIAIRNLLQEAPPGSEIWTGDINAELASIMLGLPNRQSAESILRFLKQHPDVQNRDALLAHAAQHADAALLEQCVTVARRITEGQTDQAFALLDVICSSQNIRAGRVPEPILQWASELIESNLQNVNPNQRLISWSDGDGNWPREVRSTRGAGDQELVSSFPLGEKYTGRLSSDPFPAPESIQFYLAGHNGYPDREDHKKNRIRLVNQETGEVVYEATPPRNDRAIQIQWNTESIAGQTVRIECIDGDSAGAYAWIAFGRFQPQWLHQSAATESLSQALNWIGRLSMQQSVDRLRSMLNNAGFSAPLRAEIARTIAQLRGDSAAAVTLAFLRTHGPSDALIEKAIEASEQDQDFRMIAKELCVRLSATEQKSFAQQWIQGGASIDELIEIVDAGWISPEIFLDATIQQTIAPRVNSEQVARLTAMTQNLDLDQAQSEKLRTLTQQVDLAAADPDRGKLLYTKHCAACHQLRGEGSVVGPQLDGAVTRSVARLLEDVVTPDRNVDRAFRTTSFLLDDGRVVVGLITDETDDVITVVESNGKPVRIDNEAVERRKEAGRSLMPGNMAEVLKPNDFADLLKYIRG